MTFSWKPFLRKTLSKKFDQIANTCYNLVVGKFLIHKLKQKMPKKVKIMSP